MRDDLHRRAEIFAASFFVQNIPIDLAGREVGVFVQIFVDEAFVVTKIEIGLGAVLGDVDLTVLIGTHGARIDVDVGIELLRRDLQPACLEKPPERGCRNALAKTGDNAAGDENILCRFHK